MAAGAGGRQLHNKAWNPSMATATVVPIDTPSLQTPAASKPWPLPNAKLKASGAVFEAAVHSILLLRYNDSLRRFKASSAHNLNLWNEVLITKLSN